MITNLPYLKASSIALAPYLSYTYNKYHLQSIEIDHSYDLANFLFVAPYLNIFQYDCQGDVILNLVKTKILNSKFNDLYKGKIEF